MSETKEIAITLEIEAVKKQLAALYIKRTEQRDAAEMLKNARKKADRYRQELKEMQLAAGGMPLLEVAKMLGSSHGGMAHRIEYAWRREFPDHYSRKRRWGEMSTLAALRDSPPLFGRRKQ